MQTCIWLVHLLTHEKEKDIWNKRREKEIRERVSEQNAENRFVLPLPPSFSPSRRSVSSFVSSRRANRDITVAVGHTRRQVDKPIDIRPTSYRCLYSKSGICADLVTAQYYACLSFNLLARSQSRYVSGVDSFWLERLRL